MKEGRAHEDNSSQLQGFGFTKHMVLRAGLSDLRGLSQLKRFHDSMAWVTIVLADGMLGINTNEYCSEESEGR